MPIGLLIYAGMRGREHKTGQVGDYESEPPDDLPPAIVGPLLRQTDSPGSNEFTATLFDLIRKGYYKSEPARDDKGNFDDLQIEKAAGSSFALSEFEAPVAKIVDAAIKGNKEKLSDLPELMEPRRSTNQTDNASFEAAVSAYFSDHKWYEKGAGKWLVGAAALFFAAGFLWWPFFISAGVLFVAALSTRLRNRRSAEAQLHAEHWEAFRHYLDDYPRMEEKPPGSIVLWEQLLVYAIAFGLADKVIKAAAQLAPAELATQSSLYYMGPNNHIAAVRPA